MWRAIHAGLFLSLAGGLMGQADDAGKKEAEKEKPDTKAKPLGIGDKAPSLAVEKWVKGEPIKGFEQGKVYVVEFWATWCGPCIMSMPHLTELQKKHKEKGLRIIGVTSEDERNTLEAVEAMVKKQGDERLGYTVAWDKGTETNEAFMEAAQQNGIPCSFVVNQDGLIAYIGHPLGLDKPLEDMFAGKHDLKSAREVQLLEASLSKAFRTQDWPAALKTIDTLVGKDPSKDSMLSVQKFMILLSYTKDYDKAYALGRELTSKQFRSDANGLNQIAWIVLTEEGIEKRDLDFALEAAKRANEVAESKNASILDTLAYAHFQKGDARKALELQKKALSLINKDDGDVKEELESRLETYKEALKEKDEKADGGKGERETEKKAEGGKDD